MTSQEVFIALWTDPESAKNNIINVLNQIEDNIDEVKFCFEYLQAVDDDKLNDVSEHEESRGRHEQTQEDTETFYAKKCAQIRDVFLFISQMLRHAKS